MPGLKFTVEPEDVVALPGTMVELKCDANYNYGRKLLFIWILNGSELNYGTSFSYNFLQSNGDLRINNISGTAYGVYQCVANYSSLAIISRPARVSRPCKYMYHICYHFTFYLIFYLQ